MTKPHLAGEDCPLTPVGHGTAEIMRATGVSSVQRVWRAHGLRPHLVRRFKLSNEPNSRPSSKRSSGSTSTHPTPTRSQIQALDRTQPGLPMKKGRAGTMTHDY